MVKLRNSKRKLDDLVGRARKYSPVHLVMVSDLRNPNGKDRDGIPWRDYVLKEYAHVQRPAVKWGILRPGQELLPRYTIDILTDPDPDNDNYTVMMVTVTSRDHTHGFRPVAMIRPDVTRFGRVFYMNDIRDIDTFLSATGAKGSVAFGMPESENSIGYLCGEDLSLPDAEFHGRLWFGPVVHPDFRHNFFLNPKRRFYDLEHYLVEYAVQRINKRAPDALIFGDNTPFIPNGFKVLLRDVSVPHLAATGSNRDVPFETVSLTVRPSPKHPNGVQLNLAAEHTIDYLVNGYEAPLDGSLVKSAVTRLQNEAVGRVVPYGSMF
jgi:hypothetical protein